MQMLTNSQDSKSKSFFGGFTSQTIRDWVSLDQFFRKDNVFIASLSKILNQQIQFEIPGIKKQISYLEKQISDGTIKITDWKHSQKQQEGEFVTSCQKMAVKGQNIRQEVVGLVEQLPNYFDKLVHFLQSSSIAPSIKYYYDFTACNFTLKSDQKVAHLDLLEYLIANGDEPLELMKKR